jgi:hypothetical protein
LSKQQWHLIAQSEQLCRDIASFKSYTAKNLIILKKQGENNFGATGLCIPTQERGNEELAGSLMGYCLLRKRS